MSNLEYESTETTSPVAVAGPDGMVELLEGRDVPLGRFSTVRRMLPHRERRTVGAWCFVDLFGPDDVGGVPGLQVPPHPHCGLQTVTWLFEGEVLHGDSLGNVLTVRPGQLNLMTAGHGIAHAEQSPGDHPAVLHGLQLWVALADPDRDGAPRFEHHEDLPVWSDEARDGGARVTVVAGALGDVTSPAQVHTPLVGAEVALAGAAARLPLDPAYEHGVVAVDVALLVDGLLLEPGTLLYLAPGRDEVVLERTEGSAEGTARAFLLGGEPFEDELVMWWNFVARTHEEIVAAREAWAAGERFGPVTSYEGERLPAPPLPGVRLMPRPRHPDARKG